MYNKVKLYFKLKALKKKLLKQNVIADYSTAQKNKINILVVDEVIPEYDKDSGSRRLTEMIKLFLKNGYGVYLLPDFKEYKYKGGYADYFTKLGAIVYQPAVNPQGELVTKEKFIKTISGNLSYAWLHRPHIFAKYHAVIKKYNSEIPFIFDMVDFHYLREKREAELSGNAEKMESAKKYLELELDNCSKADKVIVISGKDKQALLDFYKEEQKMVVISNIHDFVPNNTNVKPFAEKKDLLFVGSFSHKPNEDAVIYLHNEIMPLVWANNPDIKVKIVGSNPTDGINALHSERFNIVGYAEDLSPFYMDARLFVAPLRYGAGIKGKIGQSLEYSLPLITTSIGAEGFDFGKHHNDMVADTAQEFAEKIITLYINEQLWQSVSNEAAGIIAPFSVKEAEKNILEALR